MLKLSWKVGRQINLLFPDGRVGTLSLLDVKRTGVNVGIVMPDDVRVGFDVPGDEAVTTEIETLRMMEHMDDLQ